MLSCSKNCKHVTPLEALTVKWGVQTPEEAQLQIHLELHVSSPDRPVPPVPLLLLPIPETTFLGSRLQRKLRKMRKHHGDVLQQWSSWKKRGIHLACPNWICDSLGGANNPGKTCSHHTIKLKASPRARHEQMHHKCTMMYYSNTPHRPNWPCCTQSGPTSPRASHYRVFHGTPHTQSTWVSCSKRFKKYIYEFNPQQFSN